jgi:hypothetical protein
LLVKTHDQHTGEHNDLVEDLGDVLEIPHPGDAQASGMTIVSDSTLLPKRSRSPVANPSAFRI